jgi:trk system potassium uptake protein TrkH
VLINVAGFFIIYVMISAVSVLIVSAFGIDFMTSMGAVAATINNIGPGLGQVGPTDNYAHLPAALKWFLSFLMMLGRLEVYTVIILLSPTFWKR